MVNSALMEINRFIFIQGTESDRNKGTAERTTFTLQVLDPFIFFQNGNYYVNTIFFFTIIIIIFIIIIAYCLE